MVSASRVQLSDRLLHIYQIVDSVRTARAIQAGQPAPDPFGLADDLQRRRARLTPAKCPLGAIVLIGLGIIFLLHTLDIWDFSAHRIWPLVLIAHRRFATGPPVGPDRRNSAGIRSRCHLPARIDGTGDSPDAGISVPARQHGRNPLRPHPAPAAGGHWTGQDFPEHGWPRPARGTAAIHSGWNTALRCQPAKCRRHIRKLSRR